MSVTRRQRLPADDRRAQIVETAFQAVADMGLEHFRTRDVAGKVGINPATLHHYFPTKEDLLHAVGEHLVAGFVRGAAIDGRPPKTLSPVQALRRELADAAFFRTQRPRWLAVSREFAARAPRDAAAASLMDRLTAGWRRSVEVVLRAGVSSGAFRADVDTRAASLLIVSALWAATVVVRTSDREFRTLCRELERSIVRRRRPTD